MPEGHTIHRYARLHNRDLGGRVLRAWSPQGRFEAGAAAIDGKRLESVDAVGKHLFYRWDDAPSLHVHLGLFGRFRTHRGTTPEVSPQARLVFEARAPNVTVVLSGPIVCALIDPDEEDALRARLGPDPLDADSDADSFVAALRGRKAPIGQVLLDQAVVAGIGNAYRAEALFARRLDPDTPAARLEEQAARALWTTLQEMLRAGERTGLIDTAEGHAPDDGARAARWVYKRDGQPCRVCGTTIGRRQLGGRAIYVCPMCQ